MITRIESRERMDEFLQTFNEKKVYINGGDCHITAFLTIGLIGLDYDRPIGSKASTEIIRRARLKLIENGSIDELDLVQFWYENTDPPPIDYFGDRLDCEFPSHTGIVVRKSPEDLLVFSKRGFLNCTIESLHVLKKHYGNITRFYRPNFSDRNPLE